MRVIGVTEFGRHRGLVRLRILTKVLGGFLESTPSDDHGR